MIDLESLLPLLPRFLGRQPWYPGEQPHTLEIGPAHLWRPVGEPGLMSVLVDADGRRYHLVIGLTLLSKRPDGLPDEALLGEVGADEGPVLAFDATAERTSALMLLEVATAGARAGHWARPSGADGSTTSVVYDDELLLKIFRLVEPGRNPEVEVTAALAAAGFRRVVRPIVTWTHDGYDLGVVQAYLSGGTDGWALALTSLRDLFGVHDSRPVPTVHGSSSATDPALAGGDFSAEAKRLGTVTAEMHRSLASAFGSEPGDANVWAQQLDAEVGSQPTGDGSARTAVIEAMAAVADAGAAIRVHGDYHLRRVLRTDSGWFVLGFEGQPWRPLEDRRRPSSPLRDVAGMVHSLHQAAQAAAGADNDQELVKSWEARNRQAFLDGYLPRVEKAGLVPTEPASVEALLSGFELEASVSSRPPPG